MRVSVDGKLYDVDMAPFIRKIGVDILKGLASKPAMRLSVKASARFFEEFIVKTCAGYFVDLKENPKAWKQFLPRKDHDILDELLHLIETTASGLAEITVLEMREVHHGDTEQELPTDGAATRLALTRAAIETPEFSRQLYPTSDTDASGAQPLEPEYIPYTRIPAGSRESDGFATDAQAESGHDVQLEGPMGTAGHDTGGQNHHDAGTNSQTS